MNTKQALLIIATLGLTATIISSFPAQLYQQQNFKYSYIESGHQMQIQISSLAGLNSVSINPYILFGATPSLHVASPVASQTYLENNTRNQIFSYITQNPGVQFRGICAALCLPLGLAEYHLGVLVRSGLVSFVRDGRYKRFFASKRFSKREMLTISLLRHKTAKRILEVLLQKKELSHSRLAGEVEITSQALTWQMKTLRNTRFVLQVNDGLKTLYSLDDAATPMLVKYLAVVE